MFSKDELNQIRKLMAQLNSIYEKQDIGDKKDIQDRTEDEASKKVSKDCRNKNHKDNEYCKKNYRNKDNRQKEKDGEKEDAEKGRCINLTPSQLLIIAGFLGGVLNVDSVLVSRDQVIQIVLSGSLKRKTQLDKIMEQIGKLPFDQVVKSIMDNT